MLCHVAAVKSLQVHHYRADFFWSFGVIGFILRNIENRILKPVTGGVAYIAHLITGHEQTQSSRICYFVFCGVFLASKEVGYSKLIKAFSRSVLFRAY